LRSPWRPAGYSRAVESGRCEYPRLSGETAGSRPADGAHEVSYEFFPVAGHLARLAHRAQIKTLEGPKKARSADRNGLKKLPFFVPELKRIFTADELRRYFTTNHARRCCATTRPPHLPQARGGPSSRLAGIRQIVLHDDPASVPATKAYAASNTKRFRRT
jgi:hypothetical protein